MTEYPLSWIEVSEAALRHNLATFRQLAGEERALMLVVKANAYGHGMVEVARAALAGGADWLAVFSADEAFALRDAGVEAPTLILGPVPRDCLRRVSELGLRLTVASPEMLARIRERQPGPLKIHLKLETGTNRQGFLGSTFDALATMANHPQLEIEGAYTHFADIEDTTDHTFALQQLEQFKAHIAALATRGIEPTMLHTACSAATLLFPETYFDMVRVGVSGYGLWPSKETLVSVKQRGRAPVALEPVMTWKTRVSQVKTIAAGETVGYGRSYKTTRQTRLGILPVGYANGYDRHLSNTAYVLVRGQRAQVRGRVMMNMIAVDVSDIEGVAAGEEVVLLGRQGDDSITAEQMASWIGTINYEVVTRAEPFAPRRLVR